MGILIKPTYWVTAAVCVLAGIGFSDYFGPAILGQLHRWQVLPEVTGLTELYFSNSQPGPKTFTSGEKQSFRFTVRNLENEQKKYYYDVIAIDKEKKWNLASGWTALPNNKQRQITVSFVMPQTNSKQITVWVYVHYPSTSQGATHTMNAQSIHYVTTRLNTEKVHQERGRDGA